MALNQLSSYEEALEALDQAIVIDERLVIAFNNRGNALRGLWKIEEAINSYEKSISLDPENYSAWLGKFHCFYALQKYEEAFKACKTLTHLNPEYFIGWYVKASCLALMGNYDQALEDLKEAVRLDVENSQQMARTDSDFDQIREDKRFKDLMQSLVGISYQNLEKLLEEKQWQKADKETARLIIRVIKQVTDSKEINKAAMDAFPYVDLNTIDRLWQKSSDGKFGFSAQRELYQQSSQNKDKFGDKAGWRLCDTSGKYFLAW